MPNVYDDQDTRLDDLEKAYTEPSSKTSGSEQANYNREFDDITKHYDDNEATSTSGSRPDLHSAEQLGKGYTSGGEAKKGFMARLNKVSGSRKRLIAGIAGGGLGIAVILIMLFLLASLLKIPGLAQNITTYQFARMTRQAAKAADRVTQEDLAGEAAGDGGTLAGKKGKIADVHDALQQKYQNLKDGVWDKIDNALPGKQTSKTILPSKVIQTLETENGLSLDYTLSSTGRKILTGMTLGGKSYAIDQVGGIAKWTPVLKNLVQTKNQAVFASDALPALSAAMKENNVGLAIRGITAIKLRALLGIDLKAWIVSKFVGKDNQDARLEEAQEKYTKIEEPATAPDNAKTSEIKKADSDAAAAEQADVSDPAKLAAAIAAGGASPGVETALTNDLEDSLTDKAVGLISPVYSIAQPICIINDGAVANSGPSINNRTAQAQAAYYYIGSGGDQQKAGSADASTATGLTAAVGATNTDLGDTNESNAYIRGYDNGYANTSSSLASEAGSGGSYDYTLLDALGITAPGNVVGDFVNLIVSKVCPALTNLSTAAAIGLITLIGSDGFGDAAEEAAGQGAAKFIQVYTTKLITGVLIKQLGKDEAEKLLADNTLPKVAAYVLRSNAKSFLLKNGTILGITLGLTEAAHLLVAERSGAFFSGLNQGTDLADEGDEGGNFTSSQLEQTQLFGAPMTKDQVAGSAAADNQYLAYQTSQQSAYTRYLSPSYADSLVSRTAADLGRYENGSFANLVASLGTTMLQPLHSFGTLFATLTGKASAAPNYNADAFDYGNVQFGWTEAEENLIDTTDSIPDNNKDSYSMANNQLILDASGEESAIATKYAQCFGYKFTDSGTDDFDPGDSSSEMQLDILDPDPGSIGTLLASGDIQRDSNGNVINGGGLCDPDNLSYDSSDPLAIDTDPMSAQKNDMIFRWRLAMQYDLASDGLINLQTVTNS